MPLNRTKEDLKPWGGHIGSDAFSQLAGRRLDVGKYALESEFRNWAEVKGIRARNAYALF